MKKLKTNKTIMIYVDDLAPSYWLCKSQAQSVQGHCDDGILFTTIEINMNKKRKKKSKKKMFFTKDWMIQCRKQL